MAEADPLTILIGMLLTAIAYYQNDLLLSEETTPKTVPVENILNKYDFIIVGGGSAGIHLSSFFSSYTRNIQEPYYISGAVLANRLTENPNWNILLIEAGGLGNELSDVPVFAVTLQGSDMDWQYLSEPQPAQACLGIRFIISFQ